MWRRRNIIKLWVIIAIGWIDVSKPNEIYVFII